MTANTDSFHVLPLDFSGHGCNGLFKGPRGPAADFPSTEGCLTTLAIVPGHRPRAFPTRRGAPRPGRPSVCLQALRSRWIRTSAPSTTPALLHSRIACMRAEAGAERSRITGNTRLTTASRISGEGGSSGPRPPSVTHCRQSSISVPKPKPKCWKNASSCRVCGCRRAETSARLPCEPRGPARRSSIRSSNMPGRGTGRIGAR